MIPSVLSHHHKTPFSNLFEMVAYAALVSLQQILDTILHPARGRRIFHNRPQLQSLHEKVSFLLDFLDNYSSDYGKRQDPELESVETKIRDAAFRARDVIESDTSNQVLAETNFVSALICLLVLLFVVNLLNISGPLIQIFIPVMHVFLMSLQSLLSVSFQNVLFVADRFVVPLMFHNLIPFLNLSIIAAWVKFVIHTETLKRTSVARYWLYASQPENQYLRGAIDDLSFIMKEVIKIRDSCSSGLDWESQSADVLSRWDFRGIGKNVVVGLDGELKEIYNHLLGYQPELKIVSIVGMGGMGKTTLARQVHDDPHIVYHFDICAWITVSQNYSLRHVMLGLLDSAKISTKEIMQNYREDELDQKLGEHLHKSLMSRRYLIVMDDVWDTNVWDSVRMFFPDNNDGSRVLLTTRLSEVASYANSGSPSIHMRFLDDGDSWNLLRVKVFGGEGCPQDLEAIGRKISKNCRGLPLAIVVVGGILYNELRTEQDWTRVSRNLNSILGKDDDQCLGILGLSYNHLPHHLKPCFLYLGAFPEDEEVHVTRVYNLWGAEGFLKPSRAKSLEEVAEEYLEDLIQRSLVLVGKRSCDGKIKTCKIHDLIRNVCRLNAHKEKFVYFAREWDYGGDEIWHRRWDYVEDKIWHRRWDDGGDGICHRLRTLFILHNVNDDSRSSYVMARSLFYAGNSFGDLSRIHLDHRLLRVLDIVPAKFNEFPHKIFKLVHLRYLGLTYDYYSLPSSISQLWNLQTIVYHGIRFGSSLCIPVEIWSLANLRHLYFSGDFLPDPPAWKPTILENLQTLVGISNFRCTKGILKSIPNLKKLGISYDVRGNGVDWWSEYQVECIVNLHQLESLKIAVQYHVPTSVVHLPKLAFPERLKKLTLSGCRIPWESMRVVGALPNLQVLKLRNHACRGQIWAPVEEQFCQLMFLLLEDSDVEQWRACEAHFPRLQRLILKRLYKLEEIPSDIGEIATLEMIELIDCLPSAVASAKQIQEEQHGMGNECLKIHTEISVGPDMKS